MDFKELTYFVSTVQEGNISKAAEKLNISQPPLSTKLKELESELGVDVRNFLPCMLGVYLSTFLKIFTPNMPSIQLAALFSAGIAPIAGEFGIIAGIAAGMLHTSIVTSTTTMYSGLNLYNNGFSAGFVAIILVPLLENLKIYLDTKKS